VMLFMNKLVHDNFFFATKMSIFCDLSYPCSVGPYCNIFLSHGLVF